MTDYPKMDPVTIEEAIEEGDELLASLSAKPGDLRAWVEAENARRAQAKVEFEAADVEVAGVTLKVGKVYNLTLKAGYSGGVTRRTLNCLFHGQRLARAWGSRPFLSLSFTQYGKNPQGYPRTKGIALIEIVAVEPVETPDWIEADQRQRQKYRAELADAERLLGRDDDDDED